MRITLHGRQRCQYRLENTPLPEAGPANALGRLGDFLQPFLLDPHTYRVIAGARLMGAALVGVGPDRRIVEETHHLQVLAGQGRRLAQLGRLAPPQERLAGAVCSLVDGRRWCDSFFHWFLDCLPRLIAAEDHRQRQGESCRVIVPARLRPWQAESLDLLALPGQQRLEEGRPGVGGLAVERLVASVAHRWQRLGDAPFDALSPWAMRWLARGLGRSIPRPPGGSPRRLYLSRRGAATRQVVNEEELLALLEPQGFVAIQPERLSLREQIGLFRGASHIVAPHGAALTNLLHGQGGSSVLELFQEGHGVRPDFFQLARINGLQYHHAICPSSGPAGHCRVPPQVIHHYLERSL